MRVVQWRVRTFLAKRRYGCMKRNALKLQAHVRGSLARRNIREDTAKMTAAAGRIGAAFRAKRARNQANQGRLPPRKVGKAIGAAGSVLHHQVCWAERRLEEVRQAAIESPSPWRRRRAAQKGWWNWKGRAPTSSESRPSPKRKSMLPKGWKVASRTPSRQHT